MKILRLCFTHLYFLLLQPRIAGWDASEQSDTKALLCHMVQVKAESLHGIREYPQHALRHQNKQTKIYQLLPCFQGALTKREKFSFRSMLPAGRYNI